MEFCHRCGKRLIYETGSKGALYCPKCGYRSRLALGNFLKFSIEKPSNSITVLDRKTSNLRAFPTVRAYCQKCGGKKAETWAVTVGSEGISGVTFYRCVTCGHTWREID